MLFCCMEHPAVSVSEQQQRKTKRQTPVPAKETKQINTHDQDGNTHLEGNIIILVNRRASLQHIF